VKFANVFIIFKKQREQLI